ncbi:hypothetical protein HK096_005447 [Nowakowskiella sp. JEL0078]|nr:hypothetical protein HK096_005447 [Nowakowskiella sp. JEL0078]
MAIDLTDPLDIINVYEDTAWDFFLFAKSKFEEAFDILKKWTVEIVDGIPHFAITVGKMVFTFILNAVENVFKAISFILEKVLGIDIMKIIEWLGYIFEWDDILETHNLIISATNIFMDMGIKSVDKVIGVVDDYFIQLEKTWTDIAIPPDLKDAKANSGLDAENKPNLNSPGGNWSGYLIEHGGVMEFKGDDTNVATIWNEVIKSTMDEMSTLASNLPTEFFQLFNEDSSISDVLDHLRAKVNILSVIKLLHKMVIEILKFFANILKNLKDLLNAKIDIPVLSALYKKINNNADLTLLDAFALLVAIPATIIYKVFSGGTTIKTDNLPFLKKSLDKFFPSEFAVVSLPVVSSDVAMDDSAEEIRKKSLAAEILPFSCITTVTYSLGSLCEIMTLSEEIILKEDEEESDRLKNVKLLMSFSSVFGLLFGIPSVFCSEPKVTGYALANLLISGWYPVVRAYIPVDIKAKGFCDFVVGIFLVSIQFYIALVEAEEDKVKDATSRGAFMEFLELLTDFIAKCSFAACKIGGMNEIPYYAGCGTSFFSVLFCIMRLSFNFEDERRHTTINP